MKLIREFVTGMVLFLFAVGCLFTGCSKENDKEMEEEESLIGTWTASSGAYNLSLKISASSYDFSIGQPGRGGMIDNGIYEFSNDGKLFLESKTGDAIATGQLKNGKLTLTFVNMIIINMLGTGPASGLTFIRSEEEPDDEDDDDYGSLIIQNLSDDHILSSFAFYDTDGEHLETDEEELKAGYQITYEINTGSYKVKVTNNKGKSYTSKTFKIIKDKITILEFDGSSLTITATGIDESDLKSVSAVSDIYPYPVTIKSRMK